MSSIEESAEAKIEQRKPSALELLKEQHKQLRNDEVQLRSQYSPIKAAILDPIWEIYHQSQGGKKEEGHHSERSTLFLYRESEPWVRDYPQLMHEQIKLIERLRQLSTHPWTPQFLLSVISELTVLMCTQTHHSDTEISNNYVYQCFQRNLFLAYLNLCINLGELLTDKQGEYYQQNRQDIEALNLYCFNLKWIAAEQPGKISEDLTEILASVISVLKLKRKELNTYKEIKKAPEAIIMLIPICIRASVKNQNGQVTPLWVVDSEDKFKYLNHKVKDILEEKQQDIKRSKPLYALSRIYQRYDVSKRTNFQEGIYQEIKARLNHLLMERWDMHYLVLTVAEMLAFLHTSTFKQFDTEEEQLYHDEVMSAYIDLTRAWVRQLLGNVEQLNRSDFNLDPNNIANDISIGESLTETLNSIFDYLVCLQASLISKYGFVDVACKHLDGPLGMEFVYASGHSVREQKDDLPQKPMQGYRLAIFKPLKDLYHKYIELCDTDDTTPVSIKKDGHPCTFSNAPYRFFICKELAYTLKIFSHPSWTPDVLIDQISQLSIYFRRMGAVLAAGEEHNLEVNGYFYPEMNELMKAYIELAEQCVSLLLGEEETYCQAHEQAINQILLNVACDDLEKILMTGKTDKSRVQSVAGSMVLSHFILYLKALKTQMAESRKFPTSKDFKFCELQKEGDAWKLKPIEQERALKQRFSAFKKFR